MSTPSGIPKPAASRPHIEVSDLTKEIHPEAVTVRGVSFSVHAGEVYCILGAAGAGKTTIADIAAGLDRRTGGQVRIMGHDPAASPMEVRRLLSYASGRSRLYGSLSPLDCVSLLTRLADGRRVPREGAVDVLRFMAVPDRAMDRPLAHQVREMSLFVSLAVARLRETPVIVLDEPTANLDSRAIGQFLGTLSTFRSTGTAVLMTTDNVLVAAQAGDRVGILKNGELLAERGRSQMTGINVLELYAHFVGSGPGLSLDPYVASGRLADLA